MECLKNHHWLLGLLELKPGKLYFATNTGPQLHSPSPEVQFIYTDKDFVYESFFLDFGPLHLGHLYRYCHMLRSYERQNPNVCLVHCTGRDREKRANAAYLVGAYAILYLGLTPKEVCERLTSGPEAIPFKPFQDASIRGGPHTISLADCFNGLQKAKNLRFFDLDDLDVDEMEEKRNILGGDLSWLIPGRFVAFCGPSNEPNSPYPRPEQYLDYFHENDVTAVIRLNRRNYDARIFTKDKIKHFDVFLLDGSNPSQAILHEFLDIVENEDGAVAVHCKAGLGRTGTLVGAYLIKHYRMTALEAISWLRICRPGSVIGNQQAWLQENENYLTRQGDIYRKGMYGDSDHIELPQYGVYSKRAKIVRKNKLPRSLERILWHDKQQFNAYCVNSSKEVKQDIRQHIGTVRQPVRRSNGEIGGLFPIKFAKTKRFSKENICEVKRPVPIVVQRHRTNDSQRHEYSSIYLEGLTNQSDYCDLKQHFDSGDVAHSNLTQGDKLNAVKLARNHARRLPELSLNCNSASSHR